MDTEREIAPSVVYWDLRLGETVHVADGLEAALALDPRQLFLDSNLLVVDGIDWRADFETMQGALSPAKREFGDPMNRGQQPSLEVKTQRAELIRQADEMFGVLYPNWKVTTHSSSWRNMRSGPEPMHFDSYNVGESTIALAIINIDVAVRVYRIGWRLIDLCRDHPDLIGGMWKRWSRNSQDFSVEMRDRWLRKKEPFDGNIPGHCVLFAPRSMWIFNPKLILHELISGNGIMVVSYHTQNSGSMFQEDFLNNLIR